MDKTELDEIMDKMQKDEISRLSNIIKERDADIGHLNYKLEAKWWEVQVLDREIKRLREALVSVRLCESIKQANQIAKEALALETT